MTTFTWFDFLWPALVGLGLALLIQYTKNPIDRFWRMPTVAYAGLLSLLASVLANLFFAPWTWPATLLFSIMAFTATQVWYLFGRGLFKTSGY